MGITNKTLKTEGGVYNLVVVKSTFQKSELDEMLKPENMTNPKEIPSD